ncbi:MAG: rhodanese-like domain-containing protein [Desulfobulbaceae bacterium]
MRWKQFFTPVASMDAEQARTFLAEHPQGSVTLLDVRQPAEYASGHIPGARLIPLPELKNRLDEIDPDKPAVVYCAIGGRSRVAAQMLSAAGVREAYNLSGGIKAWNGSTAVGPVDQGMELFSGAESVEDILIAAYSLEKGLREFYQRMTAETPPGPVKELFNKLFGIEIIHQNRLLAEYNRLTGKAIDDLTFDREIVAPAVEGGLTTDEYLDLFEPDLSSPVDVVGLAMSIEAQALDMYQRAADNARDVDGREMLSQIALEEQEHLKLLGDLMDDISQGR